MVIGPFRSALTHYDLRHSLQDKYLCWLDQRIVKDFGDYADFCFKTFGNRVLNWFTFNELRVVAALGYDNGFHAPGRCSKAFGNCTEGDSAHEPYIVSHNTILAHAAAVRRYKRKYQEQRSKAPQRARDFHIGWFIHHLVYDEYPKTMQEIVGERLPKFTKREKKLLKGSMDYVGINQYTTYYMYNPNRDVGYQNDWNVRFACMDQPGNVTLPDALNDTIRVNYHQYYLKELKKAIDNGANVAGYFAWPLLNNFEWTLGYTVRFGITYVDYSTLKRYPKQPARWFNKLLQPRASNH